MSRYLATLELCCADWLALAETGEDLGWYTLEDLVLVNDLDAMLVRLLTGVFANVGEMRVHHHARCGGVSNIARSGPVDLEEIRGHTGFEQPRQLHVSGKE